MHKNAHNWQKELTRVIGVLYGSAIKYHNGNIDVNSRCAFQKQYNTYIQLSLIIFTFLLDLE